MTKKKRYYMERIGGNDYYTSDQKLYEKKKMQDKWLGIYENCAPFFILSLVIGMLALTPQQEFMWKSIVCWVITGVGAACCIVSVILAIVAEKKIDKYEWQKEFEKSKECIRQTAKYKKIEKAKQEKIKTEKATKLVESYEILDSKQLSKEEKIELIKKYID